MENTITNYIEGDLIIGTWMGKQPIVVYGQVFDESGESLNYHNNWASLMDVVERIEEGRVCNVYMQNNECKVSTYGYCPETTIAETKIEAVYTAVLSFINWHNKQLKTEG